MGKSSGPDVQLFKSFQRNWKNINISNYEVPNRYPKILGVRRREQLITFAQSQIDLNQPRDDYLELLELVIIFLGQSPTRGIRFRAPGPMHNARWMSKAIYAIKVWLFRGQCSLMNSEELGLLEVCLFVASAYVEAWYSATNTAAAPRTDLEFSKRLKHFSSVNRKASESALQKLANHLWYLSEELIPLALFDEKLADDDRQSLVESLSLRFGEAEPPKKLSVLYNEITGLQLSKLGSRNSMDFFSMLSLSSDFLAVPVNEWKSSKSYIRAKEIIDNLKVVNDHAERGVKLMQDYNRIITKNEDNYQDMLIAVSEQRK